MPRLHAAYLFAAGLLLALSAALAAEDAAKWSVVSKAPDLTVYARPHKDSSLREFKAIGLMAVPPEVLKRVLDDVEAFPRFVPYVTESRLISRTPTSRVNYQRISVPVVGDRDYTVRVRYETRRAPTGDLCFCNRWEAANDLGPAEKPGVTRVKVTEGSWLLEPTAEGREARVTYRIFSDSGGSLPAYLVNMASKTAIPKLFEAIRRQAQLGKYSALR